VLTPVNATGDGSDARDKQVIPSVTRLPRRLLRRTWSTALRPGLATGLPFSRMKRLQASYIGVYVAWLAAICLAGNPATSTGTRSTSAEERLEERRLAVIVLLYW